MVGQVLLIEVVLKEETAIKQRENVRKVYIEIKISLLGQSSCYLATNQISSFEGHVHGSEYCGHTRLEQALDLRLLDLSRLTFLRI